LYNLYNLGNALKKSPSPISSITEVASSRASNGLSSEGREKEGGGGGGGELTVGMAGDV
jgi:hypothetical protein